MIFKQFYLDSLGHASYLIGSEDTGEALVLDPRRDVELYLEEAGRHGLRVQYAVETHQHNDYVAGSLELTARVSLEVIVGDRAEVAFPARRMGDGEQLQLGEVTIEVLHTPGHTPEHISLLVTDRSRGKAPALLLAGGALLVGDVARPDLLGGRTLAEQYAAILCQTLQQKILTLEDYVEVFPTHVAGSLCGGHISSRLSTTIGYERRMNAMLASASKHTFVGRCVDLDTLPAVPPYWKRMRALNQQGPPVLGTFREPLALQAKEFKDRTEEGLIVLDCRSPEAFAGAHLPGALNVGLSPSFPTWAGTILPADAPFLLVLENVEDLWTVCWHLLRIGYALPEGWLAGGIQAWRTAAFPLQTSKAWTVWDLDAALKGPTNVLVLDVRQPQEWKSGHIRNALYLTGGQLPSRLPEVPKERAIAVVCGSGYRSSVAVSLLAHHGYQNIVNVLGGMTAWKAAGFPTTME